MNVQIHRPEDGCRAEAALYFDAAREIGGPTSVRRRSGPRTGVLDVFAHDLKRTLANLSLLIECIVAGDGASDRQSVRADRAGRRIRRLEDTLRGLLQKSQALGGPFAVAHEDIDLADIVETVAGLNEPLAARRRVRLHSYLVSPLPIRGDVQLLMQAMDNLIEIAVKHTRPGGRVTCEAGPAENGGVVIRVIDEGPGLGEADLNPVLRPVTRLSSVSDAPSALHGIGLWIVRFIAEQHGGSAEIANNRSGCGATSIMRLPAAEPQAI